MTTTDDNSTSIQSDQFSLGGIYMTLRAREALTSEDIHLALSRHTRGDWGDVCTDDAEENEHSLREGFRLLSAYRSKQGVKFLVITEADRSSTAILLPEEC